MKDTIFIMLIATEILSIGINLCLMYVLNQNIKTILNIAKNNKEIHIYTLERIMQDYILTEEYEKANECKNMIDKLNTEPETTQKIK